MTPMTPMKSMTPTKPTSPSLPVRAALVLAVAGALAPGPAGAQDPPRQASAGAPAPKTTPVAGAKTKPAAPAPAPSEYATAVAFYEEQAKAGWTKQRCDAAASRFEKVAGSKKLVDAWYNAGVVRSQCNQMRDAERAWRAGLELDPKHAPSLAALGEITLRAGRLDEAEATLRKAVAEDKNQQVSAGRTNLAWILYQRMRAAQDPKQKKALEDEAVGNLQRALAVESDNVVAMTLLALFYLEGAERNQARADVAQLLIDAGKQKNERYAPLWNASGVLNLKRNRVSDALADFKRAVEIDPRFIDARLNAAQILVSARKYEEAESELRQVVKLQPKHYDATVALGVALRGGATLLRAQGDQKQFAAKMDEAEKTYLAAMGLDSRRPDAYYNLGLLWKDYRTTEDDPKKNIAAYQKAKQYFADFLSRAAPADTNREEAQGHVQDCDKYVQILGQAN